MRGTGPALLGITLALALGCGGGASNVGSGPEASKLVYTAPADTSGWWLKADAASTSGRLVLDLMAPSTAAGQGVTLTLTCDAGQATWHAFGTGVYLQGLAYPDAVVDVTSLQGSALRIVAGQTSGPVAYGSTPVLQVGLDLGSGTMKNTSIPLSVSAAGHLSGGVVDDSISVQIGALEAQ